VGGYWAFGSYRRAPWRVVTLVSVVALVAGLCSVLAPPALAATPPGLMVMPNYSSFVDASAFTFNGQVPAQGREEPATTADGSKVLRIAYPEVFGSGSTFWKSPIGTVDGNGEALGFSTQFQFRDAAQGEGFTFMLAGDPRSTGSFRGYRYLNNGSTYVNSVAVAFATSQLNQPGEVVDAGANDVQIVVNSNLAAPVADAVVSEPFYNQRLWSVWVTYDAATHLLSVWASPDGIKPATPTVTATVDIAATVGSTAFAGFTAGNGYSSSAVDIYSWRSDGGTTAAAVPKVDASTASPIVEGATVTLDASASHAGPADTAALVGYDSSSGVLPQDGCAKFDVDGNDPGHLVDGVLKTGDTAPYRQTRYSHRLTPGDGRPRMQRVGTLTMEAAARVESSTSDSSIYTGAAIQFIAGPGWTGQLNIGNNEIFLWDAQNHRGASVEVDTTSAFHRYRVEASSETRSVAVYYDNALVLTGGLYYVPEFGNITQFAGFGALTNQAGGITAWQYFKNNALTLTCPRQLSYKWRQIGGPPVVLSDATAIKPTFRPVDDGDYRFELVVDDGASTGVATLNVRVTNAAPTVTRVSANATATDGLAEITAWVTDPGLLDRQQITVDWGDGSAPQTALGAATGTGWAAAQAGHRYATTGIKTVTVHATDNAGASSPNVTATISVGTAGTDEPVSGPGVSIFANASTGSNVLKVSGSNDQFSGAVHSNRDIKVSGSNKSFTGGTEYATTMTVSGSQNTFTPVAQQKPVTGFPKTWPIADYRPGGRAALAAGAAYHSIPASQCQGGKWSPNAPLTPGLYYTTCKVQISGSNNSGNVTIAAEGDIKLSGSQANWQPYLDQAAFVSGTGGIDISGSNGTFGGALFAPLGALSISGSGHTFACGLFADTIDMSGSGSRVDGGCGGPTTTTVIPVAAPPVLVPKFSLDLVVDKADATLGETLTYTATAKNGSLSTDPTHPGGGATLYVPGLIGLTNRGTSASTITGVTYGAEYHDKVTNTWVLLSSTNPTDPAPTHNVAVSGDPIPAAGVTYPSAGNRIDMTVVPAGATAAWASAAVIDLTPAQVTALLDPTKVDGFRNTVTFTLNNANASRTIARFYDQPLDAIRDPDANPATTPNGATLANAVVTIDRPGGVAATLDHNTTPALASLAPGAVTPVTTTVATPIAGAHSDSESDTAYLARLDAFDNTKVTAGASARATAAVGPVLTPSVSAMTTLHVPIIDATVTGAPNVNAGGSVTYTVKVRNHGSATATGLDRLTLLVSNSSSLTVAGLPATLAPGAEATGTATWAVPADTVEGDHTVTLQTVWGAPGATATYGPTRPTVQTRVVAGAATGTITLTPERSGPLVAGTETALTAHLVDRNSLPAAGVTVTFAVQGITNVTAQAVTDANGDAVFRYAANASGTDTVRASAVTDGLSVNSAPATVGWITAPNPVEIAGVTGRFFAAPTTDTTFTATPASTPLFAQSFPNIAFNPPTGIIEGQPDGIDEHTHPFTNVNVDPVTSHAAGTVVASGNGHTAGADLASFDAVFTGTLNVAGPGPLSFAIYSSAGYILGVGGGATHIAGDLAGVPTGATTAFDQRPVVGAVNALSDPSPAHIITIDFPAAGAYPFELDYFNPGGPAATLVLSSVPEGAGDAEITVPGTANIFGAGRDVAPSPGGDFYPPGPSLPVNPGFALPPGGVISFPGTSGDTQAYGCGGPHAPADGVSYQNTDIASWNGISGVYDPSRQQFLTGVFIGDNEPVGNPPDPSAPPAPDRLRYSDQFPLPAGFLSHTAPEYAPQLNQVFFIGDGRTDNGDLQKFHIPTGATRLFLGMADAYGFGGYPGAYGDNCGHYTVNARNSTPTVVPPADNVPNVLTTTVENRAYPAAATDTAFTATAASTAALTVATPTVAHNTPTALASGSTVNPTTVPVTDLTTDSNGTAQGTIPLTAGGTQVGAGALTTHQTASSATFLVTQPGVATLAVTADNGWVLGIGDGATAVTGPSDNAPAQTAIGALPVLAAHNQPGPVTTWPVTVDFPHAGTYHYELDHFSPTAGTSTLTLSTLTPAGTAIVVPPVSRLTVTPSNPNPVTGQSTVTVGAYDAGNRPIRDLPITLDQTGTHTATLTGTTSNDGQARFTIAGPTTGADALAATATIAENHTVSNVAPVTWQVDTSPPPGTGPGPVIGTITPDESATVTQPTPITVGPITPPPGTTVTTCAVTIRPAGTDAGSPEERILTTTTGPLPVAPAPATTLDPTVLDNGIWTLTVLCVDSTHSPGRKETTVIIDGNLKLGRYRVTYQDLNIPVGGTPIAVQRTYDTNQRLADGDFGHGWNLELSNFRVQINRPLGDGPWTIKRECIPYPQFGLMFWIPCFEQPGKAYVTVTWPDGHTETFDFKNQTSDLFPNVGTASYQGRANTTSKLAPAPGDEYFAQFGGKFYTDFLTADTIYNPSRFQLTAKDGTKYILDTRTGLVSATDRRDNTVTVDDTGVHSSLGPEITWTRDDHQRITKVTAPDKTTIGYGYDSNGDLTTVTDQAGRPTTFAYQPGHYLNRTDDAGPGVFRTTTYAADGRLATVTDANGHTTQINADPTQRTESVTAPDGTRTTTTTFDTRGNATTSDEIYADPAAPGGHHVTAFEYTTDNRDLITKRVDPLGHTWAAEYDPKGNLTTFADAEHHSTTLTYDDFGSPKTITAADGLTTTITYDDFGSPTVLDTAGHAKTSAYDDDGNPVAVTDENGHTTRYGYTAEGWVRAVMDPNGHTSRSTYDANGRVTTATDALNRPSTYTYDPVGNLTRETMPGGRTRTTAYDTRDLPIMTTDEAGFATQYGYDAVGNLTTTRDALGGVTTTTYDAANRATTTRDPAGRTSTFTYNGAGQTLTSTDPLGHTTSYEYDTAGRQIAVTQPARGRATTSYDANGLTLATTNGAGETTTTVYDPVGRPTTVTDALNRPTVYGYDAWGRQTDITNPAGERTHTTLDPGGRATRTTVGITATTPTGVTYTDYEYDDAGNSTVTRDATGRATTIVYDAANRVTATKDNAQQAATYAYDDADHLTQVTTASGIATRYTYDPRGLQLTTKDALNNTTTREYDPLGRMTKEIDARTNPTTYQYNAVGQQTRITDALGGTVNFGYDNAGNQTSVTDPNGNTRTFTYDAAGAQLTQTMPATPTQPAGAATTHTYDLAGRPATRTDARGLTTTYGYNAIGELTSENRQEPTGPPTTVGYSYDGAGRRTTMTDPTGVTTTMHDPAGRITSVAAPQGTIAYGYDPAGRRTSMTLPSVNGSPGGTVNYTYDTVGRSDSMTEPGQPGKITHYTHTTDGRLNTIERPNGVQTDYLYDPAARLTGLHHRKNGTTLADFDYALDANGNRVVAYANIGGQNVSESYQLDALNRLKLAQNNQFTQTYNYDATGNRTTKTQNAGGPDQTTNYHYDAGQQLTSADGSGVAGGSESFQYDANGNLTSQGANTFSYDSANRVASAVVGGQTHVSSHDADGVRTTQDGQPQLWDRTTGLPQLVDSGTGTSSTHGPAGVETERGSSGTTYPLSDAIGSLRAISDPTGSVIGSASYDAYGDPRSKTGVQSSFGYAGEQTDATGLINLRARNYDPTTGRFLQSDSVQPNAPGTQGLALYPYAAGNPVNNTDPSGMSLVEDASTRSTSQQVRPALGLTAEEQVTWEWTIDHLTSTSVRGAAAVRVTLATFIQTVLITMADCLYGRVIEGYAAGLSSTVGLVGHLCAAKEADPPSLPVPTVDSTQIRQPTKTKPKPSRGPPNCDAVDAQSLIPGLKTDGEIIGDRTKFYQTTATLAICVQAGEAPPVILYFAAGGTADFQDPEIGKALGLGYAAVVTGTSHHAEMKTIGAGKAVKAAGGPGVIVRPLAITANVNFCVACYGWLDGDGVSFVGVGQETGWKRAWWPPGKRW
jgi:RHS repeat-associated protein